MHIVYNFLGFKKNLSGTGVFALSQLQCLSVCSSSMIILAEETHRERISKLVLGKGTEVYFYKKSSSKFLRLAKSHLVPIYFVFKYKPSFYISPLAIPIYLRINKRTRQVITIHDIISKVGTKKYSFFRARLINLSFFLALRIADRILVLSPVTKNDILANFAVEGKKFTLVHNVVSNVPKHLNINQKEEDIFLVVGNVQPGKNPEGIIRAFVRLKRLKKFKNTRLVFVGNIKEEVQRKLEELVPKAMKEFVNFKGYVDAVNPWYGKARVVVLASFYEGFGIPILEAYSYRKPLVLSETGSMPYVGGDAAYYCNPYDIISISDAMEMAYARLDMAHREEMMIERIQKFSYDSLRAIYADIIK